ncbi:hypothetical protein CHISP_1776 [Chitinispirillum alkaliphilum]|nr:hypothetical protein CHISP_1776 [Chitinispirillum alkaliphilum]
MPDLILKPAVKELKRINLKDYERIKGAINSLAHDPWPQGSKRLSGRNGWRIRIGDYRSFTRLKSSNWLFWFFILATGEMSTVRSFNP